MIDILNWFAADKNRFIGLIILIGVITGSLAVIISVFKDK